MDPSVFSGHEEIENFSPPAFHGRESPLARLRRMTRFACDRTFRDLQADLADQPDRFMDLVHAHAHAGADIPVSIERDLRGDFVVRGERAVAPDVLIDTRRPSDDADDAMIPGDGLR